MAFSKLKSLLFCWIFHVESGDAFSSFSYNTKHPSSLIYNGGMNLNTKMPHHYFPIFKMPLFSFKLPQAGNDGAPKSDFESVPIISSRKTFMKKLGVKAAAQAGAIICVITSAGTRIAMADMYSGSTLPEGAQQFGRAIRMRSEWDDIGRRLSGQKELSNKASPKQCSC